MQQQKLDVLVAMFAYAGNGGVATVLPDIALWMAKRSREWAEDDRIGRVGISKYGDIPLTMERNRVVKDAKDRGFDVILMLDSDNVPDLYLGHRGDAKPFWETSFDLLYERKSRGLPTVVCAPYCGPPPHPVGGGEENVYVFYAQDNESDAGCIGGLKFEAYSREHSALMHGIQPCAAGPTGCIVYSTDAFDLMPVHGMTDDEILEKHLCGELSSDRAKELLRMESWFWYEYTDGYQTNKASTEDVTNTREIQMAGVQKHGEPVVFCNWDAWAGHMKPKCVGAPQPLRIEQVSNLFAEAVRGNLSVEDELVEIDFTGNDNFDPPADDASEHEGEEYTFNSLDRQLEKRSHDGSRLGKMFKQPAVSEECCEAVRNVLEKMKANRCVVIGDMTGELCHAAHWNNRCSTYAIKVGEYWGSYGGLEHIKLVGMSSDERQVEDPVEVAQELPAQELDGVVVHASEGGDAASVWMEKHVHPGGVLVIVDPEDVCPDLDLDVGYEHRVLEGTGIRVVVKRGQSVASSV